LEGDDKEGEQVRRGVVGAVVGQRSESSRSPRVRLEMMTKGKRKGAKGYGSRKVGWRGGLLKLG
jgi:hypothetical protein